MENVIPINTAASIMSPYRKNIEKALQYSKGTHTYSDVVSAVEDQSLQFWPGENSSFLITELVQYPQKKSLHIFLSAGELPTLKKMIGSVELFAKELKCDHITICGRHGWKKIGKDYGYKVEWSYLYKELEK